MRLSAASGHFDIVNYLVENGADIHADNEYALRESASGGHLRVVEYLAQKGADIHADTDFAIRWSARNGHFGSGQVLDGCLYFRETKTSK